MDTGYDRNILSDFILKSISFIVILSLWFYKKVESQEKEMSSNFP